MRDDVCIVGGGPAGSTLAIRLARLGYRVAVYERSRFDRPRPGESLSSTALALLPCRTDTLVCPVPSALVRWEGETGVSVVQGSTVARPQLDLHLLDCAREAGVDVRRTAPDSIDARFVVDASGRAGWSRVPRTRTGEPTVAIAAHVREGPREPRVEALADGWLWGAPIPDGTYSVMAFVDAGTPADTNRLNAMCRASELFRDLHIEDVRCHDATTYASTTPIDERSARVGEASFAIDPLSASGVQAALQSAVHAAAAIHTILTHPERTELAIHFYEDAQRAAVANHARWAARFYAESAFASRPFWSNRAAVGGQTSLSVPSPSSPRAKGQTGVSVLHALGDVTLADVPCLVGDVIESRAGVVREGARPFVWLGGHEVAPLLAPLAEAPRTFTQLTDTWNQIPEPQRASIFAALVRDRIVIEKGELYG